MSRRKGPNLQNVPIRTTEGKRIRDAFSPGPALDLDYEKIEQSILDGLGVQEDFLQGDTTFSTTEIVLNNYKFRRQAAQTALFQKVYGGGDGNE